MTRTTSQRPLPRIPGVRAQGGVRDQDKVLGLAEFQEFALLEVQVTFHLQNAKQPCWAVGTPIPDV